MPRVPTLDAPQAQNRPLPTPGYGPVDPPALGALAEGLNKFGQGLDRVEDGVARVQLAADQARVQDAYAQMAQWQQAAIYDPKQGALTREGRDALGLTDRTSQAFEDKAKKLAEGLANDNQRKLFERVRQRERETVERTVSRHETQQGEALQTETYKAALEQHVSSAANAYSDPRVTALQLQAGEEAVQARALDKGWTGEQTDRAMAEYRSALHLSVLDRMMDAEQPDLAKAYLERYGSQIDGAKRGQANLDTRLRAVGLNARARDEADQLARKYPGDMEEQLRVAQGMDDATLSEATTKRLVEDHTRVRAAHNQAQEQGLGSVYNEIERHGGYLDTSAANKEFTRLDPEYQAKARARARTIQMELEALRTGRTNQAQTRANAEALAVFHSLPAQLRRTVDLAQRFPQADSLGLAQLARAKEKEAEDFNKGLSVKRDELSQDLKATAKELKLGGYTDAFVGKMQQRINTFRSENDNRMPTQKELEQLKAEELVYGKTGWLGLSHKYRYQVKEGEEFEPYGPGDQPYAPNRKAPRTTPDAGTPAGARTRPPATLDVGDIDPLERRQIEGALRRAGRPTDDNTILDRYNRMHGGGQ